MLGWHISIYRQICDGASPAKADSPKGTRLAVWQTGICGLNWIYEIMESGKAIDLGGCGYPSLFTVIAEDIVSRLKDEIQKSNQIWVRDECDVVTNAWEGKPFFDSVTAAACRPDEWLFVEAWDES